MKKWFPVMFLIFYGCASLTEDLVPELSRRTLLLREDRPGLYYSWRACTKWFLGVCRRTEIQTEEYDLNNQATRDKLINMGFVVKVRERVSP